MSIGTVRLQNAVFYAHHGVMQEEHTIGGRYEVDVAMDLDFEEAATTDDLSHTVDYEHVYHVIHDTLTQNRFYLIERLAFLIASQVLSDSEHLVAVQVRVRKANPPVGGPCDFAEAVYRCERKGKP